MALVVKERRSFRCWASVGMEANIRLLIICVNKHAYIISFAQ
jgi:hypothetical protein